MDDCQNDKNIKQTNAMRIMKSIVSLSNTRFTEWIRM